MSDTLLMYDLNCLLSTYNVNPCHSTGIMAITLINEAIDKGEENETVKALELPAAKLRDINAEQAFHYQVLLARQKDKKAEVSQTMSQYDVI